MDEVVDGDCAFGGGISNRVWIKEYDGGMDDIDGWGR